jgi:ubiquinone/menaquinone biosynthesis C-methylase UbiE
VAALGIRPGQVVADVGCGSGYFVPYLSRAVGAGGRVYAVEIQQEMLDYVERKVERLRLKNVATFLSQETSTGLPPGSIDVALLVDVYAELGAPRALLADLRSVLKGDGRLVVVDFRPDKRAAAVGPPLSHRIAERRVKAELEAASFRLLERHDFLPYQYFLVFGKTAQQEPAGRRGR